jgi:mannose-6-phosphate isomerase-like protein (cupin superfamily)
MKHLSILPALRQDPFFRVLMGTGQSQVAVLVLQPGQKTGGLQGSDHPQSDQVVYVLEGKGEAQVRSQTTPLQPGDVLIIEAGEPHELRCTGEIPLRTLNVYAPPAY